MGDTSTVQNIAWLNSVSVLEAGASQIKRCLLLGLREYKSDFSPLHISQSHSAIAQLKFLFYQIEPYAQEVFKEAVVRATQEWQPIAYGAYTLQELSCLVADVRAFEAVSHLRVLMKSRRLEGLLDRDRQEAIATILSVLAGFVSDKSVKTLFKELFWDDEFSPFAAQLFWGLCVCESSEYPEYIPRMLDLMERQSEHFIKPAIMTLFVKNVPLPTICENFTRLDSKYWRPFIKALTGTERSPLSCRHFNGRVALLLKSSSDNPVFFLPTEVSRHLDYEDICDEQTQYQNLDFITTNVNDLMSAEIRADTLLEISGFIKNSKAA